MPFLSRGQMILSLISLIAGSLVLRAAGGAMGEDIQYYFNAIHDAATNPSHPLRLIAGEKNVYPISYTFGGLIIVSFFASELIGSLILGAWSDRYGRKLFIILGPLLGAIAVQITALTTVIWLLIVTRLLEGLSTASNAPATLSYLAETTAHSPKVRSRVTGLFEIATIGGIALGFLLGGRLWRSFGTAAIIGGIPFTSPAFALTALFYLASFLILWLGLRNVHEKREPQKAIPGIGERLKGYWEVVSTPRVAQFAPAWIAINGVIGVWSNLTARMLTDRTDFPGQLLAGHFTPIEAGYLRAVIAVVLAVGILIWSLGFSTVKRTTAMLIGIGGLFVVCGALYGINHQPALNAPLIPVLTAVMALSLLVMSGFTPSALAHLADITEGFTEHRGAIMGMYSVFLGLGQFVGVALGGPLIDRFGADGVVLTCLILAIVSGVLVLRLHIFEERLAAGGPSIGTPTESPVSIH